MTATEQRDHLIALVDQACDESLPLEDRRRAAIEAAHELAVMAEFQLV